MLGVGLIVGLLSLGAQAYTDDFTSAPAGNGTTTITTGTASTGLQYAGTNCDFVWDDTHDEMSSEIFVSGSASFAMTSRDGKAFVFQSIYIDNLIDQSITITGSGPEPFTVTAPGNTEATYSPGGGDKHVTEVVISNQGGNDFFMQFDTTAVDLDVPGAAIKGNGQLIVNGDNTPSSADDTDMGETPVGTPIDKVFTIESIGDASLDLTGSPYVTVSNTTDFSVHAQPTTDPIASGSSDTFTIRFSPASNGVKQAIITLGNDSEADPYTFTVQGEGAGSPEIDVQRPAGAVNSIADDGTDAQGSKEVDAQVTLTYTVENTGDASLSVTNISSTAASGVTVDDISPTTLSIAATASDTFAVKYTPTAVGAFSFELDIANDDDPPEDNYDITVSGNGVDTDPPDVSSIVLADGDPTNASSVDFTVTFDESVTGVDTTDFVLDVSGLTGASIDSVGGGGTTWTVSVGTGAGDSMLSIDLSDDDSIEDGSGNKLGGAGVGNGSFTAGETYRIDKTAPSVPDGLSPADSAYVNTGTPTFSWNESTDTGGSGLRTTNTYRYQVSGPTPKDDYTANTNYTPSSALADGVYTWRIYSRGSAGNNSDWSTVNSLTVDTDKPDVTIDRAMLQVDPTNSSPVVFRAEFDEPIDDATFTDADVSVGGTASTGAVTVTEVAPNDDTTFEVSIVVTGDGTVQPTIPAGGVEDPAGNTNNASTSTDNSVTYDTDPPGVTSFERQNPATSPTNADDLVFRVTFDEDVPNVDTADFTVNSASTAIVDMTTQVTPDNVYDVTVRGGDLADFNGTVNLDLAPGVDITDFAGNPLPSTPEPAIDETYMVDNAGPDVTVDQAISQADPTDASPVAFTAVFGEPINDATFTNADVNVGGTATTGAVTVTEIAPNDDTTFEVSIVVTGDGTVRPTIPAGGIEDPLGNANVASTSIDNSVTYDSTKPNVTIDQAVGQADPTNVSPARFSVVFDEPVDDATFTNGDLNVGGTATTGAVTVTEVSPNDGTTFEVSIVVTGDGTVTPTISADGVEDLAGNANTASTSTDNSVTVDTDPPGVNSVAAAPSQIADATAGTDTFTVTTVFDEAMNTGTILTLVFSPDVTSGGSPTLSNGSGAWSTTTHTDDTFTMTYDVADRNVDVNSVMIDVTGAVDLAGNGQEDYAPVHEFDVDTENPTIASIASTTPDGYYGLGSAIDVTVTFPESVTLAGGTLDVTLDTPSDVTSVSPFGPAVSASTIYPVGAGDNSCDLDAIDVTLNGGTLRDAAGNDAVVSLPTTTIADGSDITVDTTDPTITWVQEFPTGTQDMDGDCSLTFPIAIRVTDNCCIDATDVDFTLTWPANVSATHALTKAQVSGTRVDIAGTVTVSNLTSCPAAVDLDVDAEDCTDNTSTSGDSVTVSDVSAPTFTWITDFPDTNQSIDDDCSLTFPIEILVEDNCCIDESNVAITVSDPADVTVANTLIKTQEGANAVRITGDVTLSALTDGQATVLLSVTSTDCCGSVDSTSDAVTVVDEALPTISGFALTPDDGLVDGNCEEVVTVSAVVRDNCCIDAASVIVTPTVTNASLKDNAISATQNGSNEVIVSGTIVVHSLTGCPATIEVEIDATDCGGNHHEWTESAEVRDDILPEIQTLRVDEHVVLDECCETVVTFDGTVVDNCCVHADGITITVTNPTNNAAVEFDQATDVRFTQCVLGQVDFSGEIAVPCVSSCPAIVQVTVNATDCCGNGAVTVVSTADPNGRNDTGHVYDETEPIPRDDPRQDVVLDESAMIDPLVEVRMDGFGVYRLVTRENTPVRIDVLANDADNCSCEDCEHPFDPCGGCGTCPGCCAEMSLHEIVSAPTYGTVTVESAEGNCGGGTVIRYAPDTGYIGPDEFTYRTRDACGNVSTEVATVRLYVASHVTMEDVSAVACSAEPVAVTVTAYDVWADVDPDEIPFGFTIVSGPSHGVLAVDVTNLTVMPPSSVIVGGRTVPTLDVSESVSITMAYTSAVGFAGRDMIRVRFSDPFGNEVTANVDILVIECVVGEIGIPGITVSQGTQLKIIVPEAFESIADTAWASVLLLSLEDGTGYSVVLSVVFNEEINRYVITVDTGPVPAGRYLLSIPLGNGETVELTIEVRAPDHG